MNKNRLVASLEAKLSKSVGYRADLQLGDVRKINNSTAHFLLSFASETAPTGDDIADYFVRNYNAKVTPYMSTARVYNHQQVVTVVASLLNLTRDIKDTKYMKPVIEGALYLDVPLEETWEVVESSGQKVLARKMKDDIMAIVSARRQKMMDDGMNKSRHQTFAYLAEASNFLKYVAFLDKGDKVKIFCDGQIHEDAEVLAVSEDTVKVKCSAKGVINIPRASVLEVLKRAPEKEEEMRQKVEDYFTEAYGDPNYAKKLAK